MSNTLSTSTPESSAGRGSRPGTASRYSTRSISRSVVLTVVSSSIRRTQQPSATLRRSIFTGTSSIGARQLAADSEASTSRHSSVPSARNSVLTPLSSRSVRAALYRSFSLFSVSRRGSTLQSSRAASDFSSSSRCRSSAVAESRSRNARAASSPRKFS